MRQASVCVVVVVVLCAASLASTTLADPTKTLLKRDYAAPPQQDPIPGDGGDSGFYYYYYPVEEDGKKGKGGLDDYKHDKCAGEKLLAPLIIISIFLGIIAFRDIGLLPNINLPDINLKELPTARDLASSAGHYIPWTALDTLTVSVTEAVESEQCMQRLVCHSGRYAEGRTTMLSLVEFFIPRRFQPHMKIFKDSALKQADCSSYTCSYADGSLYE